MEDEARKNGRTRIVSPFAVVCTSLERKLNDEPQILDTQTGSGAEVFYERMGYQKVKDSDTIQRYLMLNLLCVKVGVLPDVVLSPDRKQYTSVTFFYKKL